MFRKSFIILLAIAMIACFGNAWAFGGAAATATATINPIAGGGSGDSADATSKPFIMSWEPLNLNNGGDDYAEAYGQSNGQSWNLGTAKAGTLIPFRNTTAFAKGKATADGETHAVAMSKDIGLSIPFIKYPLGPQTSIAGSAVGTEVTVRAGGVSGFKGMGILGGGIATNESGGFVQGDLSRQSWVNEVDSGPTFAQGKEESAANFYGEANNSSHAIDGALFGSYDGQARSGIELTGTAFTAGGSIAYIEPNGDTQSAFAAVGNMAVVNVEGDRHPDTNVSGSGDVNMNASAQNNTGGAYAGGTGSFSYSGAEAGVGATIMQSSATVGNNSFSSQASGASFATSK